MLFRVFRGQINITKLMKTYVALAPGFEIAEATLPIDILKRAGVEVITVSITGEQIVPASNGVRVVADTLLNDADLSDGDMLFLPGGMPGSSNLAACQPLAEIIREYNNADKYLAAVCAAPMVYGLMGLLDGKKATCYPGFEDKLLGANFQKKTSVCDGNMITGCGAGAGFALGRDMAAALVGEEAADAVLAKMMFQVYE